MQDQIKMGWVKIFLIIMHFQIFNYAMSQFIMEKTFRLKLISNSIYFIFDEQFKFKYYEYNF